MSPRKFYKTVIQVTVYSEDPFEWDSLHNVDYSINEGDCVGKVEEIDSKQITGKQAADGSAQAQATH